MHLTCCMEAVSDATLISNLRLASGVSAAFSADGVLFVQPPTCLTGVRSCSSFGVRLSLEAAALHEEEEAEGGVFVSSPRGRRKPWVKKKSNISVRN